MSIAAPVLETADPNSISTLPITLEELMTGVIGQVNRAQSAADQAGNLLEDTEEQAALAEAARLAAVVAQTAAAASAAAAAAQGALSIVAINAAELASIGDVEDARDQAIIDVLAVSTIPPVASQLEATTGTENTKIMSPLRVAQAISAQGSVGVATLIKFGAI